APIGATASGALTVDLRRDGPHGLAAGTTGAGKSELLQTLVAALSFLRPPTRATFLLIDYKGGAAFKECVRLPHAVGFVTDLDSHLTHRALISLNAELRRRESILRDAGAKDLVEMERLDPERAPASLIIVIDEFATLVKEVPEFVDGVVDVAQRGRSLGVHLLLATQRPAGVVSANIRANTNARIALRVNDSGESEDVIGAPDAARIPRSLPGRGFIRTGHSELTEFQTAYVGGRSNPERKAASVAVHELTFGGVVETTSKPRPTDATETETDLERIVEAVRQAAADRRVPPQPSPWLPPLSEVVPLDTLSADSHDADPDTYAVLGLVDEPALQRQRVLTFDLDVEGNLLVYGASGAGKTTLLRTLATSLALRSSPDELHIYALDFATRGLRALEALPHCGSVIVGEDEERITRLFSMLRKTIAARKDAFATAGAATLSEYRRSAGSGGAFPRILVLLNGYGGFVSAFERVNFGELLEALPRLVTDGRPLGVHFAISADRRASVPGSLAGLVSGRVVLRMADEDDYASLGIDLKAVRGASLPPGRGFVGEGLEVQCALVGDDPGGQAQAAELVRIGRELAERFERRRAPRIDVLPAHVAASDLPAPSRPLEAVVGLGDEELAPVILPLDEGHFLVVGPYRSGRSTALATIAHSLRAGEREGELHLLAPRRSPLTALEIWDSISRGVEESEATAASLAERIASDGVGADTPLVVVVDDGDELADTIGASSLQAIVRAGRDANVRVVAAVERQALQRAYSGWLSELRKEQQGLLLDPDLDVDGDLLGVRLPRRTNPVFPPGRGYLVRRGEMQLIQVATP
ncbi:MAG: FtsK/SpoIIIE domain-containing protein, partial [Actinomycetota bacterium]|nr:FtsK/SpoIIIE domain-containing protein [Actinomycetota bacterium]